MSSIVWKCFQSKPHQTGTNETEIYAEIDDAFVRIISSYVCVRVRVYVCACVLFYSHNKMIVVQQQSGVMSDLCVKSNNKLVGCNCYLMFTPWLDFGTVLSDTALTVKYIVSPKLRSRHLSTQTLWQRDAEPSVQASNYLILK